MTDTNVCNTQDSFNKALVNYAKYHRELMENRPLPKGVYIYLIFHLIVLVWAVFVALQQPQDNRVIHLVLAILFAPVYLISYYIGMLNM